ncbi:hypothetical protein ACWIUD_06005 [Helicobacter sp. 23-1044]
MSDYRKIANVFQNVSFSQNLKGGIIADSAICGINFATISVLFLKIRHFMEKRRILNVAIFTLVFALIFIGGVILFSSYFVKDIFGKVDFGQILFHLQFPLLDNNTPFVGAFVKKVILPAIACAFVITFPQITLKIIINFATKFYAFLKKATLGKLAFAFALFALCLNITNNKLKITRYLKTQTEFSNLYEAHYKPFDSANLTEFAPKQNLIVILAESLESTFSGANIPNGGGGESHSC